ncbi:MAG: hypothetical protein IKX42_05410 [Fibrobacter sp.]|nr:hypothetical protein [Fibrobacter sp.]
MKFYSAMFLAASLALMACGDDSSSSGPADETGSSAKETTSSSSTDKPKSSDGGSAKYDCTVSGGVKVLYPAGGEEFKMGDTITVIYGSDVQGSGYRFAFKVDEADAGMDMFKGSVGPESPDGKTCYEQKVVLSDDYAEPSDEAIIRVIPYERQNKGANSGTFKVKE